MRLLVLLVDFFANLSKWNVILGLVIAVTAFVLMIFTTRIVRKLFPNSTDEQKLNASLRIRAILAVVALAACILAVAF